MYEKKLSFEEIINPEHFPESFLRKKECRSLLVTVSGIGYMAMAKLASVGIRFYGVYESYDPDSCYLSCRYQLPEKHALYRERNNEVEVAMIFPGKSMAASMYMIPEVSYDFETLTDPIVPGFKLWPCKWITYSATDSAETVLKGLDYLHAAVPRLVRSLNTRADQCIRHYLGIDRGPGYKGRKSILESYFRRVRLNHPVANFARVRLMDTFAYAYIGDDFIMFFAKRYPGITVFSIARDISRTIPPVECDDMRRFIEFCKRMPNIEHLNNAARDALFETFVARGITVTVNERLNDDGEVNTIKFEGNPREEAILYNSRHLYRWELEDTSTSRAERVSYSKSHGAIRKFPGEKTQNLNDGCRSLILGMNTRVKQD